MAIKLGIYAGSFNPWHKGHDDILKKALAVFDNVLVLQYQNDTVKNKDFLLEACKNERVEAGFFSGFLVDAVKKLNATAIIRGLRNGVDLDYEKSTQYWNEDLGLKIPTVYFMCDRNLVHLSSSSIREIHRIEREEKNR